jgi:hypothetical protein
MKEQIPDDQCKCYTTAEETMNEEKEANQSTISLEPLKGDKVIDSPVQSPPKPKSMWSVHSKSSTSSQESKGVALVTPTKATGCTQGPVPSVDITNLKTPKMTISSKRPPSKSPSASSKSPGNRTSSSKSPKMHTLALNTSIPKPERQPSARSGLSLSSHSNTSQLTKSKTGHGSSSSNRTTSSSSDGDGGRPRRRRKVQWKKSVRVNVIPNLSNFSKQEKLQTWYTADEYSLMEDECDLTSECLDARKPLWPGFCGRGLESWTVEGEQRKDQHVQSAIDIVWQAQLDQWRQASNTDECWEFIRSQYLPVSQSSLKLASQLADGDEHDVQAYLSSVRALEKSRRKMLGIRSRNGCSSSSSSSRRIIRRGKVVRTVSDTSAYAQQLTSQSAHGPETRSSPRRTLSDMPSTPPSKLILRPAIKNTGDWNSTLTVGSGGRKKVRSKSTTDTISVVREHTATKNDDEYDDDTDASSTLASSIVEAYSNKKKMANKKIEFRPKSKTKVPTSPVGSLAASIKTSDSNSMIRRMRSHLSVSSDESTRRRMMRTVAMTTPL